MIDLSSNMNAWQYRPPRHAQIANASALRFSDAVAQRHQPPPTYYNDNQWQQPPLPYYDNYPHHIHQPPPPMLWTPSNAVPQHSPSRAERRAESTAAEDGNAGNEDGWSFWTRVYDEPELKREIDESNRVEGRPTVRQVMREVSTGESAAAVLVTRLPADTTEAGLVDHIRFAMPDIRALPTVHLLHDREGQWRSARVEFNSAPHAARFIQQFAGRAWPPQRHVGRHRREMTSVIRARRMAEEWRSDTVVDHVEGGVEWFAKDEPISVPDRPMVVQQTPLPPLRERIAQETLDWLDNAQLTDLTEMAERRAKAPKKPIVTIETELLKYMKENGLDLAVEKEN